jgi:hypothetical protein
LSVGRKAEARHILAKYHGNDDENAPLVLLEWKEFEEAIKLDASDKRWYVLPEVSLIRPSGFSMCVGGIIQNWSIHVTRDTGLL